MAKKKAADAAASEHKKDVKPRQKQQHQRQPQQQRSERSAGGMQHYSSFLQVLAVDIDHTSPSVLLFFDKERYLFNAGEGIQRLFREHKIKIKQVTSYFITRISTETLGGLPGMALSVVPEGAGGLLGKQAACSVKGPRGLADYVASFRSYINAENSVEAEEIDPASTEPILKTDVVSITPIVVSLPQPPQPAASPSAAEAAEAAVDAGPAEAAEGSGSPAPKRRRTDVGGVEAAAAAAKAAGTNGVVEAAQLADVEQADAEGRQRPAGPSHPHHLVAYAVQLAGRPGKFLPDRARALGVTPGPLFGELQRGRPVTTDDGRTVQPAEVMEAAVPGPALLLLDTPSLAALEAVAADERVLRFAAASGGDGGDAAAAAEGGGRTCIAVHMAPAAVIADDNAMASLRSALGPRWRHVVVTCGPHQPSSLPRASVFQAKLHAIHPTAFPLFALDNAAAPPALPEGAKPPPPPAAAGAAPPPGKSRRASGDGDKRPAAEAENGGAPAAAESTAAAVAGGPGIGGKGAKGKGGGAAAPQSAAKPAESKPAVPPAAGGLPLLIQQQWPVLPLPPGGCVAGMSAVRLNLMPLARQGLEYVDVFQYDNSSKVLDELRADPEYGEILSAAAAVCDGAAPCAAEAAEAPTGEADAPAGDAVGAAAAGPADAAMAEAAAPGPARVEAEGPKAVEAKPGAGAMETAQEAAAPGAPGAAAEGPGRADPASAEAGPDVEMADGVAAEGAAAGTAGAAADAGPGSAPTAPMAAEAQPATAAAAVGAEELPGCLASGNRRLAELTFLGTASSQPSKYRNVSGCYVDLFERGGLLVDCGEDAMGQMKRRFGGQDAERRLLELRLVWVSHMHADHHGGLYRLLEWRARRAAPPLLVIGPRKLFEVLVRYAAAVPLGGFAFLSNFALSSRDEGRPPPAPCVAAYEAAVGALGLRALQPFAVDHVFDSHGLRLEGRDGWSVVFSGDTRPCGQTVAAARGATLLVHEATFEESMQAEARAKKHSTTAEAVAVGERAGAYRTLLTHFSTRYPTLPELDLTSHPRVAVAMDLMSVNLADLPWLPRLVRPMGLLFARLEAEKLAEPEDDE